MNARRAGIAAEEPPYAWLSTLRSWRETSGEVRFARGASQWVAAGLPQGPKESPSALPVAAFGHAAARAGARASALSVTAPTANVIPPPGWQRWPLGWEGWWDPAAWPATLAASASLRAQVRRAHAKGVRIRPVSAQELAGAWASVINRAAKTWSARREMAPLGFVVKLPADLAGAARDHGGRVWVATHGKQVVAVAAAFPLPGQGRWLLQHLLRLPRAPNGTSEAMVDAVLKDLARPPQAAQELSLGMVPLHGVPPLLRAVAWAAQGLFDFRGLSAFKEKLRPHRRTTVSFLYGPGRAGRWAALWGLLRAFAENRPLWFAAATLARGPRLMIHLLAWLLVPWTIALAWAAPSSWFPSACVRWAWVAFDVGLSLGFFAWRRRRHRYGYLLALTSAVGADAAVTTWQVLAFNVPRGPTAAEATACAIAVLGPCLAWGLLVRAALRLAPAAALTVPDVEPPKT